MDTIEQSVDVTQLQSIFGKRYQGLLRLSFLRKGHFDITT